MNQSVRVIKAGIAPDHDAAVNFNYEDLQEKCERYLAQIRQQAQTILTQAQQETEQQKAQAEQSGFEAGYQKGLQQAEQEIQQRSQTLSEEQLADRLNPIRQSLEKGLQQLELERRECLARWETQLVELSLAIAEKVIHHHLPKYPEATMTTISHLLQLAIGQSQLKLYLNEDDHQKLGESLQQLNQSLNQSADAEILIHPELMPGDCRLETSQGSLDARIQTQLERISEELLDDSDQAHS